MGFTVQTTLGEKHKKGFLVKYVIEIPQCQQNCGEGTLGYCRDILGLNPDEIISPLCNAALQAEE